MAQIQKAILTEYANDGSVVMSNIRKGKADLPIIGSNETYSATLVTEWYDGSPMDDSKADGVIYLKYKGTEYPNYTGSYFRVNLPNFGELFLEKDTAAQMRALSLTEILLLKMGYYKGVKLNGYYQAGDTPAPIEYLLSTTSEEDDGGSVFEVGGIKLEHDFKGYVHVSYFGAIGDGIFDNTDIYSKITYKASVNSVIEWYPSKVYKGSFNSTKPLVLLGNFSRLISTGVNDNIISFKGEVRISEYQLTSPAVYGDSIINLNSIEGIDVNDIIVLHDNKGRPSDDIKVNYELLKVKSIDAIENTIEVYDMVRSMQNEAPMSVDLVKQIKNVEIYDFKIESASNHWAVQLLLEGVEDAFIRNIETYNNVGSAVSFNRCFNFTSENIVHNKPRLNGGGQGYGSAYNYCREGYSKNITGYEMRHVIDNNSCYTMYADNIKDFYSFSAIQLCHNTFGGNFYYKNILVEGQGYAALHVQGQGLLSPNSNIFRDSVIENVTHIMKTSSTGGGTSNQATIRFTGSLSNIQIKNINTVNLVPSYEDDQKLGNAVVNLDSCSINGDVSIDGVIVNKMGTVLSMSRGSAPSVTTNGMLSLNNVRASSLTSCAYLLGTTRFSLYNSYLSGAIPSGNGIINIGGGGNLTELNVGKITANTFNYYLNTIPSNLLNGQFNKLVGAKGNSNVITAVTNLTLSRQQLDRYSIIKLSHTFSSDITLSSSSVIPIPNFWGEQIDIQLNSPEDVDSYGSVIIPNTNTNIINEYGSYGVTIKSGETIKLIGDLVNGNKVWRVERVSKLATPTVKGLVNQATAVGDVTTADATDDTEAIALVNELKAKINAMLTSDRASGQRAT